ncbi:unnamed protein product [Phytomonas sp. Hart1]|nr:unnamed protein product [Phytomonas sp. Hart1]|eukprot:CCW71176.1 unnamed protein product [Phytomonas sp. isolate Hart1]
MEEDALRQRLTEANTHLSQMRDEEKRVLRQRQQELNNLKAENDKLRDRLEELRMLECRSYTEQNTLDSGGAQLSSTRYRTARDLVQRKQNECGMAESKLGLTERHWRELRRRREQLRREALNRAAAVKTAERHSREETTQTRHRLRTLEQYIEAELERLSGMAGRAKTLWASIDALLIAEANFEKPYRLYEKNLLDKRKEMSFVVEICNLVNEERLTKLHELEQLKATVDAGSAMYKRVMDELNESLKVSESQKKDHMDKVLQLQQSLREVRRDRSRIEQSVETFRGQIFRIEETQSTTSVVQSTLTGKESERLLEVGATAVNDTSEEGLPNFNDYEGIYEHLTQIVGSDNIEDVIGFLHNCNEMRFQLFSELNYLNEQIREIDQKRRKLTVVAPTESAPPDPARVKRVELQDRLNALKLETKTLQERSDDYDGLVNNLVGWVQFLFYALGCRLATLRERAGVEKVSVGTVCEALALIDQRLEEYLVVFAQKEHQTHKHQQNGSQSSFSLHNAELTRPQRSGSALTILHRTDLPKKEYNVVRNIVEGKALPRSNIPSKLEYEENTHESKENQILR